MSLELTSVLTNRSISRSDKLLVLLAHDQREKPVKEIQDFGVKHGLRDIVRWNVSTMLSRMGGKVVRLPGGWAITSEGKTALASLGLLKVAPSLAHQPTLRHYASGISNPQTKQFLEECILALEQNLYRSAVVLSWAGAVSILYDEIIGKHLVSFNAEAKRRFPKWTDAKTTDDLTRMKEYDFLQVLNGLSVIGKNTKDELEQCLKLRNTCAHPNTHAIGDHRVAAHVETLVLNVYAKFPT